METLDAASAAASKKLVDSKVALTAAKLKEQIDLVRGAVLICYPVRKAKAVLSPSLFFFF